MFLVYGGSGAEDRREHAWRACDLCVFVAAVAFIVELQHKSDNHRAAVTVVVVGAVIAAILLPSAYGASKAYCNSMRIATTSTGEALYADARCMLVFGHQRER